MNELHIEGDKGALMGATLGVTASLLLALFIHPLILLAIEGVAVGGAYAYHRFKTGTDIPDGGSTEQENNK